MIEALNVCAFQLSKAAHAIAMAVPHHDTKAFIAASEAFQRLGFAVRMGIRLACQLRAGQAFRPMRSAAEAADAIERPEPPELERPDRPERDVRERERDYEPVSLPKFLKTLGLAARDAEARRDELPAHIRDTTLPRLKSLLAQAEAEPPPAPKAATGVAVLARPPDPRPPVGRSRLLTSTVTPALRPRDSS